MREVLQREERVQVLKREEEAAEAAEHLQEEEAAEAAEHLQEEEAEEEEEHHLQEAGL